MVGPLIRREIDPNRMGRGPGEYYHRAHGYYSKANSRLDAMRDHGPMKVGRGPYHHTTDHSDYRRAPSYPTNKPNYEHERTALVRRRMPLNRRRR